MPYRRNQERSGGEQQNRCNQFDRPAPRAIDRGDQRTARGSVFESTPEIAGRGFQIFRRGRTGSGFKGGLRTFEIREKFPTIGVAVSAILCQSAADYRCEGWIETIDRRRLFEDREE